jgi:hypothetical protein
LFAKAHQSPERFSRQGRAGEGDRIRKDGILGKEFFSWCGEIRTTRTDAP